MPGEIINAMCCVRGLRVASRSASFRFRDGSVDPRAIAAGVGHPAWIEHDTDLAGLRGEPRFRELLGRLR